MLLLIAMRDVLGLQTAPAIFAAARRQLARRHRRPPLPPALNPPAAGVQAHNEGPMIVTEKKELRLPTPKYCESIHQTRRRPTRTIDVRLGGGQGGALGPLCVSQQPAATADIVVLTHISPAAERLQRRALLVLRRTVLPRPATSAPTAAALPDASAAVTVHDVPPTLPQLLLQIGPVKVGSAHRIALQTMTTTDTRDVAATVEQVGGGPGACGGLSSQLLCHSQLLHQAARQGGVGRLWDAGFDALSMPCADRSPHCAARPPAGQEVRGRRRRHCAHHRAGAVAVVPRRVSCTLQPSLLWACCWAWRPVWAMRAMESGMQAGSQRAVRLDSQPAQTHWDIPCCSPTRRRRRACRSVSSCSRTGAWRWAALAVAC